MIIYGLIDPSTGFLRYVGKTANPLVRLRDHCCPPRTDRSHRANWIRSLRKLGMKPVLEVLEEVSTEQANDVERFWIASLRAAGADLVNCSDGGDGVIWDPGRRDQLAEAARKFHTGRKRSAETRRKISEALTASHPMSGRRHSDATRAKMRDSHLARVRRG